MPVSHYDDLIDSRDVIARIEHLRQLRRPGPVDLGPEDNEQAQDDLFAELAALEALASEGENASSDWEYGATLVRDSYFERYAEELAEDVGAINPNLAWPYTCIDWGRAARELQQDYSQIEFNGVTYWTR